MNRDLYLNRLIARKENGAIKVVTGIRRCGKSYLLFNLYYQYLLSTGIDEKHVICLPLDDDKFEDLRDRKRLRTYIDSKIEDNGNYYIFLDEIQLCEGFEGVLNGLNRSPNLDIYVTGSNSKFLSSDIITEFRGRGDEVRVYPLSFAEFYMSNGKDFGEAWNDYVTFGGLPALLSKSTDEEKISYLETLLKFTYEADIVNRNKLKDERVLDSLINILASSVGSLTNPKKIADTFNSSGIKTSDITIKAYIGHLLDAFIIQKAERYNLKGKKYISTPSKYYFTDIGLRNAQLGFRQQEETHLMENVIFNELKTRGYNVDVGVVEHRKVNNGRLEYTQLEIDFVCNLGSKRYYIQSAYAIPDEMKMEKEQRSLLYINDYFKKIIITRENIKLWRNDKGITIMSLKEFLTNPESLDL